MSSKRWLVLAILLALVAPVRAAQVVVFAAASLTDALGQAAARYEKTSGDKILFNLAASGTLARQIEAGAPADLFFSADEARADFLQARGLLVNSSRRSLLGNALVIITPPENHVVSHPSDLTNAAIRRIALGQWKTVPAGTYSKAYLEKLGLWRALAPKIVPCENVRAVLAAVASGNVDAGIVYRTDAAISSRVKIAFEVPAADAPKISYPVALVKDGPSPAAAKRFLEFLSSPAAARIFRQHGFLVPASSPIP